MTSPYPSEGIAPLLWCFVNCRMKQDCSRNNDPQYVLLPNSSSDMCVTPFEIITPWFYYKLFVFLKKSFVFLIPLHRYGYLIRLNPYLLYPSPFVLVTFPKIQVLHQIELSINEQVNLQFSIKSRRRIDAAMWTILQIDEIAMQTNATTISK